jgi:hypothetical protein
MTFLLECREPMLGDAGFVPMDDARLRESRRDLLAHVDQATRALDWIHQHLGLGAAFNPTYPAATLRKLMMPDLGEISQGAVIVGMAAAGFRYDIRGADVVFDVATRSVRHLVLKG